jgi:hypothetical protein
MKEMAKIICGYRAVGENYNSLWDSRDKDGMYLVMDDTYCCYFYKPELFEIISDPYGILIEQSIYYSYNESKK